MACEVVEMPGGGRAIVCSRTRRRKCKTCGRPADRLCDWKKKRKKSGTCDEPICATCTTVPAKDKDLCPTHARDYQDWLKRQPPRTFHKTMGEWGSEGR